MAVKFVEKKAQSAEALADSIVQPEVVDEYATLKNKLTKRQDNLKPLAKQVSDLEKGILGATDEVLDPSVKVTIPGEAFELELGAKGQKTILTDVDKVFEILGFETFMKVAKVSVSDLKSYLNPDQLEEVTEIKAGAIKRRVKIVKL